MLNLLHCSKRRGSIRYLVRVPSVASFEMSSPIEYSVMSELGFDRAGKNNVEGNGEAVVSVEG